MITTLRARVSETMLRAAFQNSIDRQQIERAIAGQSPNRPGHDTALLALHTAQRMEAVLLWVGWRLQPRQLHI